MKKQEKKEEATSENKEEKTRVDPEKDAECEEIIKKKCYYEILGVAKESTEEEIKRSYKKLALKFHPDKNQSQHASEAFKKVLDILFIIKDFTSVYNTKGCREKKIL
jgi:DnaJ-domain-containing protein 1